MALKGDVKDFNLDEIIRFICAGKKAGSLDIDNGQEAVSVYFKNGGVYFVARSSRPDSVTERVLSRVDLPGEVKKELASGSSFPPSAAKLSEKAREEVAAIILEQAADAFADVLSWPKGQFAFKPGQQATREDWGVVVDAETFLEESRRRGEIFTRFFRFADSLDVVLVPNEDIAQDDDVIVSGREWAFLCALREHESLGEVVASGAMSLTTAMMAATSLLEKGLLKVAEGRRARERTSATAVSEPQDSERAPEAAAPAPEAAVPAGEEGAAGEEPAAEESAAAGEEETAEPASDVDLIDELAAITGGLAGGEGGEPPGETGDTTREELLEILKSLKKL